MNIVVFGFNDWHKWSSEEFRTRCGQIVRRLDSHPDVDKVLVVSTARSYAIALCRILLNRFRSIKTDTASLKPYSIKQVTDKIYMLDHLRFFPREEGYEYYYLLNGLIHDSNLRKAIKNAAHSLGMADFVLWVSNPLMAKHIGKLGESVSVFDAIDDWTCHPQKKRMIRSIKAGYELARKNADIIFTVSRSLAEKLGRNRSCVYWQPNGVDVSLFEKEYEIPDDIAVLPKPIIGYVGFLQERVDVGLLEDLARQMPNASIVLVGPVVAKKHFESLRRIKNIHFLGKKPYSKIPAYIKSYDVCIMPHYENEFTASMNPLKVYEYIAAKKPVVTKGLMDSDDFAGLAFNTTESDEFINKIQVFMSGCVTIRLPDNFIFEKSWTRRVEQMLSLIPDRGNKNHFAVRDVKYADQ